MSSHHTKSLFASFVVFILLTSSFISVILAVHSNGVKAIDAEVISTLEQIGKVISSSISYENHVDFASENVSNDQNYRLHLQKFQQVIKDNPDISVIHTSIETDNGFAFVLHTDYGKRLTANLTSDSKLLRTSFNGLVSKSSAPFDRERENIEVYIPLKNEGTVYAVLGLCMKLESYKTKIQNLNNSTSTALILSIVVSIIVSSSIVIVSNFKDQVSRAKRNHITENFRF